MQDRECTVPETLHMAHRIAREAGLKFAYVGNIRDTVRQSTYCPNCDSLLIERDGYRIAQYHVELMPAEEKGRCHFCKASLPGRYKPQPGNWGAKRQPIRIQ